MTPASEGPSISTETSRRLLVDVLQRIGKRPVKYAVECTPGKGMSHFVDIPRRSDPGPHDHDPPSL